MEIRPAFGKKELYAVVLLALISFFLFSDQNLMAPNLTQIANDFGFGPIERDVLLGGNISFMFWLFGGLVTLLIGYLTDRISRKTLFIITIILGEIPCLLTGFAQTYTQLFWLRALTGIAIGGALPLTYSLIGDYFSHRHRATAAAWITLAQALGIAAGQFLAGFIGPDYGWRLPFIIVALPNFLFILLFLFTVKEPARGGSEDNLRDLIEKGKVYTAKINWSQYKSIFKIKSNIILFLQGIPGCVPWGVFLIYLNDFYAQDKGFTVQVATLIIMATGAGILVGGLVGGLIGDKIYNVNPKFQPLLCGATTLLGIIPMAFLLNYPSQIGVHNPDSIIPLVVGFITGIFIRIATPNTYAMLLNVNAPETRGSVMALFNLTNDLGLGIGPVVISLLIMAFGRLLAFNIANLFWIICGIMYLSMIWTYTRDQAKLGNQLLEKARTMKTDRAINNR